LPPILLLVRDRPLFAARGLGIRIGYFAGIAALAWQWIVSLGLTAGYMFVARAWAIQHWKLQFLATFILPILVFALMLVDVGGAAAVRTQDDV
jgi:hypothetical protein